MANTILQTVAKAFKVTENRLRINEQPVKCDNDWIGNGYWFVRRAFEPVSLNKYKIDKNNMLSIEPILNKINKATREIILRNDLKMFSDDKIGIKFDSSSSPSWADVYFVSLFDSVQNSSRSVRFWQEKNTDPILVKINSENVGIIAPFKPISSVG